MTTSTLPRPSASGQPDWATAWLQWRPELPEEPRRLTVADLAECICPDLCNRDHPNE